MHALTALGQNVEIAVTPSKKKSAARIAVAARTPEPAIDTHLI
jgi:hypothetical protein